MTEEKTVFMRPEKRAPKLVCFSGKKVSEFYLSGQQKLGRPGKSTAPDLPLAAPSVSRNHGEFQTGENGCRYRDLGSTNGTFYNQTELKTGRFQELHDGDVLKVRVRQGRDDSLAATMVYVTGYHDGLVWQSMALSDEIAEISVGREETIALSDRSVSRKHASFFHAVGGWSIIDHDSLNGVYVNNQKIERPVYLLPMDVVRISGYLFFFAGDELFYQAEAGREKEEQGNFGRQTKPEKKPDDKEEIAKALSVPTKEEPSDRPGPDAADRPEVHADAGQIRGDADMALCIWIEERNVWNRMKKKTLLKDIKLDIPAGSMVLILGGSGAGKTTFMNAVMGYEPAKGAIRYRGTDIYDEYEKMKYEIGYVPQQDLVRGNDTVYATLLNAAQMRLPKSLPKDDYILQVQKTLQILGLEREKNSLVSKLSGGQRKRLSIAIEYIGNPPLFFLDEPDSGLDGTMARNLMENLRTIADEGKIVIVISHAPDRAFELWDQVIVLAKDSRDGSGHLVYYGDPVSACGFFEVRELEQIVKRINRPDEGGDGKADYYIERFAEREGKL